VDVSKLTEKAAVAAERGNYDYAIDLYLRLLELEPKHIEARQALRAVEIRKAQGLGLTKSSIGGQLKGIGHVAVAGAHFALRKYDKAITACEGALRKDPYNRMALVLLAKAAGKAEYLDTAIQALEEVRGNTGAPTKGFAVKGLIRVLRRLAELYTEAGKLPLAAERLEEILRLAPGDRDAERRIRNVAAQRSMVEGGWDKAGKKGGYREVLKDEDAAKRLEDTHRDIRTREDVENAIERVKGDLAKEPENTRYLLQLGDLYKMLKDWNQARGTYERGHQLDPSNFLFVERLGDLRLAEMDEEIERAKAEPSTTLGPGPAGKAKVASLHKERMIYAFKEYQKRVQARPQDLPTRFAFGSVLFEGGRFKEASVQFQHASRDPRVRRTSLYRLGVCFQKQGLVDLAVEQFEKAVAGASLVDQEAKDILYALGEARASQGRAADALDAYKRIFEIDINFRDVSRKIEDLYKQGARESS
jgi:tetratricopeptide (TPR) repeat protein